jgi:hypothetical protein
MSLNLYGLVCEVFDVEFFVFHFEKTEILHENVGVLWAAESNYQIRTQAQLIFIAEIIVSLIPL